MMSVHFLKRWIKRRRTGVAISVLLVIGAALFSAPSSPFRVTDKAFYADERTVNFVRPGLQIRITRADIAADGTLRVVFRLSDPRGLPLDREGITTPGAVSLSFVAAYIPRDQTQYVAYTTRTQTSPITGRSAIQAAADTGGRFEKLAEGEYAYTFGTKLPANADRTATHSVLIYGSRNLTEFDLGTNYYDTVFTWVPAGGPVVRTRDVVRTATCNKCHFQLAEHGGARRSMEGCVICHTPQTTDPDTGNTVDLTVLVHKIHMGADLPSVQNGGNYCIVGFNQNRFCYDKVHFPPGANTCEACHVTTGPQADRPAQADAHLKNPSRAACGSCHDNVNFETGLNHVNLPQPNDSRCATCHIPQGELEFDASIINSHITPRLAPSLPGVRFTIERVEDGVAGRNPKITFTIKNKKGEVIAPQQMTRLAAVLSGPTTDYATVISENVTNVQDLGGGRYLYAFTQKIPDNATGSFTIHLEGYRNATLLEGTTRERTVRDAARNVAVTFSVDGRPVTPRRTVVTLEKCNACHFDLSVHGDNRNEIASCATCHNATATDAARRPQDQNPPESIQFATMIHRIHSGSLQQRPYTIFGFGNVPHNYNEVGFPGDLANCNACHVNNSHRLPLPEGLQPVNDPRHFFTRPGPEAAACLGCHATRAAAAHAAANTNEIGESCASCHGLNAAFSVDRVHAR